VLPPVVVGGVFFFGGAFVFTGCFFGGRFAVAASAYGSATASAVRELRARGASLQIRSS
jgi:hypothetical protein